MLWFGSHRVGDASGDRRPRRRQAAVKLARSSDEEEQSQLKRLAEFHARNTKQAPAALERLKRIVTEDGNVFAELVNTVRVCSPEQIRKVLFEVAGEYRRSM